MKQVIDVGVVCNQNVWDRLVQNGYFPLVLDGLSKAIHKPGWMSWREVETYRPGNNIGIRSGPNGSNVVGIDADIPDFDVAAHAKAALLKLAPFPVRIGAAPKFLMPCVMPDAVFKNPQWEHPDGRKFTVQIIAASQFVAFGFHSDEHGFYKWQGRSLLDTPRDQLPVVKFGDLLDTLDTAFAQLGFVRKVTIEGVKSTIKPFMTERERAEGEAWSLRYGRPVIAEIERMGPKTGRGSKAFALGSAIAATSSDEFIAEIDGRLRALDEGDKHARELRRGLSEPIDYELNIGWRHVAQQRAFDDAVREHVKATAAATADTEQAPVFAPFADTLHVSRLAKELEALSNKAAKAARADKGGGEANFVPAVTLARNIAALVESGAATPADVLHVMGPLMGLCGATNTDIAPTAERIEIASLAWRDFKIGMSYEDAEKQARLTLTNERANRAGNNFGFTDAFDGTENGVISEAIRNLVDDGDPLTDVISAGGDMFRWDGRLWKSVHDDSVVGAVELCHGLPYQTAEGVKKYNLTNTKIEAVLRRMRRTFNRRAAFGTPAPGVMLQDGFLTIGTDGAPHLNEAERELYCRADLPYSYDEVVNAPSHGVLDKFLADTFKGDPDAAVKVLALQEGAASTIYALHSRLGQRGILWLIGAARSGKGVFMEVLERMVPNDYATTIDPRNFADNRFYSAKLAGKRLAYNRDTDVSRPIAQDVLKRAVDCEPIDLERKHRDPSQFTPNAQWVMASNEPPRFAGGGDNGMAARLIMVRFSNTRAIAERDRTLPARLIRDDGAYFMRWALEGALRMARSGWNWSPGVYAIGQAETGNMFLEHDPVRSFVEDKVILSPGGKLDNGALWAAFEAYASHNFKDRDRIPTMPAAIRRIVGLVHEWPDARIERVKTHGQVKWAGIALRP